MKSEREQDKHLDPRTPNLFIIGAPKCGTTSLYYYLSQHPDIYCAEEKEPHYYNTDSEYRFYSNEDKYLTLYNNGKNRKYRCDSSTWYFNSDHAIEQISAIENVKVIFMVRNPIKLFFSLHKQLLFSGEENEVNPIKAFALQQSRALNQNVPKSCIEPKNLKYSEICNINNHIRNLRKVFNGNILFVKLEDLSKEPQITLNNIFNYLEIENYFNIKLDVLNTAEKSRKSLLLTRIIRTLYKLKKRLKLNISFNILNNLNKWNYHKNYQYDSNIYIENIPLELKAYEEEYLQI